MIHIIRLSASLISFGGPVVGERNDNQQMFPQHSMLTGLIGNALGYDFTDHKKLNALSIQYAVSMDKKPTLMEDFQTVKNLKTGWKGNLYDEHGYHKRGGGGKQTIRTNDYWQNGQWTVAFTTSVDHETVRDALIKPARTLFLGRKCCIPNGRLYQKSVNADSPKEALRMYLQDLDMTPHYVWNMIDGPSSNNNTIRKRSKRDWSLYQSHTGNVYYEKMGGDIFMGEDESAFDLYFPLG